MIISQVAAMAANRVIGLNNQLPWNIPEDLKFFKQMTQKKILIMGRKTFDSLPGHLPGRFHIVISRSEIVADESDVAFVTSLPKALELAKKMIPPWPEEVMIIGGAEIYKLAMPFTDRIYLTEIKNDFKGDTFFPEFSLKEFQLTEKRQGQGEIDYSFCTYSRI